MTALSVSVKTLIVSALTAATLACSQAPKTSAPTAQNGSPSSTLPTDATARQSPAEPRPQVNDNGLETSFEDGQSLVSTSELPPAFQIDSSVYATSNVPFIKHTGSGPYQSYLALNVPFEPIDQLRQRIERDTDTKLTHRGEAHITVVTPPEFDRLKSVLSIDRINELVEQKIQTYKFDIQCLARGTLVEQGVTHSTYYLIIASPDVIAARNLIAQTYRKSGGVEPAFISDYFPHITVGFTHRDLHASDGVRKNGATCVAQVTT